MRRLEGRNVTIIRRERENAAGKRQNGAPAVPTDRDGSCSRDHILRRGLDYVKLFIYNLFNQIKIIIIERKLRYAISIFNS